jgi:hypothetical protein
VSLRPACSAALALLCLLGAAGRGSTEEDPLAAPIRAILLEDDLGLRKVYDGIRKGLELAQLPRVALEPIEDSEEAFAHYAERIAADPPPLLFAVGRKACDRVVAAGISSPRVLVDTCVDAGEVEYPAAPSPEGVAVVVRGATPVRRWAEVLRGAGIARAEFAWEAPPPDPARLAGEALLASLGLPGGEGAAALLDLRLGLGERRAMSPAGAIEFSDDIRRHGKGAVVVLAPDHPLLGRRAADAGRRLLAEADGAPRSVRVRVTEVRVDLEAARVAGWEPPLPFVAGADAVRGSRR